MKEMINIAELLKDCPKDTELYSPIFGNVYLCRVRPSLEVIVRVSDRQEEFLYDGRFGINGECMLFPSKENRDWSTFQRPFKDGDVVAATITSGIWMGIFKQYDGIYFESYCSLSTAGVFHSKGFKTHQPIGLRFATEEEKQKLFDAIKANGYKWNPETKTLDKLVEPKFKVGDRVLWNYDTKIPRTISKVELTSKGSYVYWIDCKGCSSGWWSETELTPIPNKFDITTLKPFDKVLVRDNYQNYWAANLYSHYMNANEDYHFATVFGYYKQCIPYNNETKHLLGKIEDCDNYYKTWEQ